MNVNYFQLTHICLGSDTHDKGNIGSDTCLWSTFLHAPFLFFKQQNITVISETYTFVLKKNNNNNNEKCMNKFNNLMLTFTFCMYYAQGSDPLYFDQGSHPLYYDQSSHLKQTQAWSSPAFGKHKNS